MSRFDEEPDGDPHGECAAEIHKLQSEIQLLTNRTAIAWQHVFADGRILSYSPTCAGFPARKDALLVQPLYE